MLDSLIRPRLAPQMDKMAVKVAQSGLSANKLTALGFLFGFAGCFLVGMHFYPLGLVLLLVSLFFDGLDGAVARVNGPTELGAYLDMMSGVLLFAMFPFFFMLSETEHALAAAILIFTYLLMGMANLSYDYFAMKKGAAPAKSAIVETGEIVLFMVLCCLYPPGFSFFAAALALMSLAAAIIRIGLTIKLLKN